jgi:hypothetical protein
MLQFEGRIPRTEVTASKARHLQDRPMNQTAAGMCRLQTEKRDSYAIQCLEVELLKGSS